MSLCSKRILATALLMTTAPAGIAHAAVSVGDTVTCAASGTFACSSGTAVIGGGTEFAVGSGINALNADFSDGLLTLRPVISGPLTGLTLSFTDVTSPITGYSLVSNNAFSGLTAGDISLASGVLSINLSSAEPRRNGSLVIGLTAAAVPEPATWGMMILGFAAVGSAMRVRVRRAALV